jgi:hypothetical protein
MREIWRRIAGFLQLLVTNPRKAIRSALTVAVAALAILTFIANAPAPMPHLSIPAAWIAGLTAAIAFLKWLLSALDKNQDGYGLGAAKKAIAK